MTLLHPWWLLPALACFVIYLMINITRDDWHRVISRGVLRYLQSGQTTPLRRHPGFLFAAIACMALTGPSLQSSDNQTFKHTQGWIVIADVSRSMTLTDIVPSRLSSMRDAALELANRANANSTTLIVYAGDAFVVVPPSFDATTFKESVSLLDYGVVPIDGSNVTRALGLASSVIESTGLVSSRIFMLSDSGGLNSRANAAVGRLAQAGHRTDLLLFAVDNNTESETSIDLEMANAIANTGGGTVVTADAIGSVKFDQLDLDFQNIDNSLLTQSGITTLQWSSLSHWVLLFAIPLLLLLFRREYQ